MSEKWKNHKKHVFILSWAGRPIYTRYGDEASQSSLMGVFSGIISLVTDGGDEIKSVRAGKMTLVFKLMGPIWLVCASSTGEPIEIIENQLEYLHSQIISILTKQIHIMLDKKPQLDIRNLLGGTDKYLDSIVSWTSKQPEFLLNSINAFRISTSVRIQISSILLKHRNEAVHFAIIIAGGKLVQILRPKNNILYPSDLHLLINFVQSTETFKENESWAPICLPKFNENAYVHQYIHYLDARDIALVLLSANPNDFENMSKCSALILESLKQSDIITTISNFIPNQNYTLADIQIKGLRHFLYKSFFNSQMTMPEYSAPYLAKKEQRRIFQLYQSSYSLLHKYNNPNKIYFKITEQESIVAWAANGFELYAIFGPLDSKESCIEGCNKLSQWIRKEENYLFIKDSPVW